MRQLASFLLLAITLPAVAAEAWRWKDDKGIVHYSDTQVPGAERVTLASPPLVGTVGPAARVTAPAPPPAPFRYRECVVLAPGNDQVFNAVNSVTAALRISPPLIQDHSIQVFLDRNLYAAWPARMLTFKVDRLDRGTHTLAVVVLDEKKQPVCTGPAISFHLQQPSLFSPARPKPAP